MNRAVASSLAVALLVVSSSSSAGPPYVTDDPEPVAHRHWEVYFASQSAHDEDGWSGTAPHIEVNYGLLPDVQLHVISLLSYAIPRDGRSTYGFGDTELGVKFRFVQEQAWVPMIGTFPLVELPTGNRSAGLGNGSTQVLVPVWLQKSFGEWQTYGGLGAWIDLGDRDRHWWYFGWQGQRRVFDWLSIGVEAFHLTPREHGGESDTRFNVGSVIDLGETHHLLVSVGRGVAGPNLFQSYIAYQLTFGPKEPAPASTATPYSSLAPR